jgi:hypothetical protein
MLSLALSRCGLPLPGPPLPRAALNRGGATRGDTRHASAVQRRDPRNAKTLRRHVDAATLEKIVNELLDVRGNRDFREAIEELARELMRR